MDRSPMFPKVPFLGYLARGMVGLACALLGLTVLCLFAADVSNHGLLSLAGIIMALGGTGMFLLRVTKNEEFYLCGLAGWIIVVLA
jgi:hypothetical protein